MGVEKVSMFCETCGMVQEGFLIPEGEFICPGCFPLAVLMACEAQWNQNENFRISPKEAESSKRGRDRKEETECERLERDRHPTTKTKESRRLVLSALISSVLLIWILTIYYLVVRPGPIMASPQWIAMGCFVLSAIVFQYVFRFQRTTLSIKRLLNSDSKLQMMLTPDWMGLVGWTSGALNACTVVLWYVSWNWYGAAGAAAYIYGLAALLDFVYPFPPSYEHCFTIIDSHLAKEGTLHPEASAEFERLRRIVKEIRREAGIEVKEPRS